MRATLFDQWENVGRSTLQATKELEGIGTRVFERLAQEQAQFLSSCVDAGVKQFSLVSQTKDYRDLWTEQAKVASEYNDRLMSSAKNTADILNDARGELASWFERGLSSALATSQTAANAFGRIAA